MNTVRAQSLNKLTSVVDNHKLLEQHIYNFAVNYCTQREVEPNWNNVLFKHIYATKTVQVLEAIRMKSI